MRLTKFGLAWLSEYGGNDQSSAPARSSLSPLRGGAFDQDGQSYVGLPRQIVRDFELWETPEETIQQQLIALKTEFGRGRRLLRAVTRDDDDLQTWAKVVGHNESWAPGERAYHPMQITFEVDYPYWLKSDDEPIYLDDGYILDNGWSLDQGNLADEDITATTHPFTISVEGSASFVRGRIVIAPQAASTIQNPKIVNMTNGMWVQWTGTLSAGDVLELQLLPQAVYLNSSPDYANLTIGSSQANWMRLEVGNNDIEVRSDSRTGTVDLWWWWSNHYH